MMQKPTLKMHYVLFVPSRKKTFLNNENLKKLQKVFFSRKDVKKRQIKLIKYAKKYFLFFKESKQKTKQNFTEFVSFGYYFLLHCLTIKRKIEFVREKNTFLTICF